MQRLAKAIALSKPSHISQPSDPVLFRLSSQGILNARSRACVFAHLKIAKLKGLIHKLRNTLYRYHQTSVGIVEAGNSHLLFFALMVDE